LVSLCRTKDFELHGGQVLNEPEIIKFLLSRCADNLVVFGKPEQLSQVWTDQILAPAVEVIELEAVIEEAE